MSWNCLYCLKPTVNSNSFRLTLCSSFCVIAKVMVYTCGAFPHSRQVQALLREVKEVLHPLCDDYKHWSKSISERDSSHKTEPFLKQNGSTEAIRVGMLATFKSMVCFCCAESVKSAYTVLTQPIPG